MVNEEVPFSRLYVISQLPRLEYLDDTRVTREEKEKSLKTYGRRRTTTTLNRGGESPTSQVHGKGQGSRE